MITVTTKAYITADNPVIKVPGVPEGNYEVVVVLQPNKGTKKRRKAGFSKGIFTMSDDFNAPLEDFKDYMQ